MKVKVKKLDPRAVISKYAKKGDAGIDLVALEDAEVDGMGVATFRTGLAIEIPEGYVGLIVPRSSITKVAARLANSVGVIDSGYRGEILVKMDVSPAYVLEQTGVVNHKFDDLYAYYGGDRIAQLIIIPHPQIELEEAEELSTSERGGFGFGSSGK